MLKLQNEKLKALFNWIKSPAATCFLLLLYFISLILMEIFRTGLLETGSALVFYSSFIFLFINLLYLETGDILVISIISVFISMFLSIFFEAAGIFAIPSVISLICKCFYIIIDGLFSSKEQNIDKSHSSKKTKNAEVPRSKKIIFLSFNVILNLLPILSVFIIKNAEEQSLRAIIWFLYSLIVFPIIFVVNQRKKMRIFQKVLSLSPLFLFLYLYICDEVTLIGTLHFFILLSVYNIYTYCKAESK